MKSSQESRQKSHYPGRFLTLRTDNASMSKETLYPERQRCKACGKSFPERGAILGLYDTYRCAKMAEPYKKPEDAPRPCVTDKSGKLVWKKRLRHIGEMPKALRDDPSANTYWCQHCGFLHIGHSRVEMNPSSTRSLMTPAQLADVLVKARERRKLSQRDAAKSMGMPWIRLKELEGAKKEATLEMAFLACAYYKIKLAAVFS